MIQTQGHGFSRRAALLGLSGASLAAAMPGGARAAGPILGGQSPGWYRFKVGQFEATVIQDGPLALGDPSTNFPNGAPAEVQQLLRSNFLPTSTLSLDQNILLINTGRQLVLFDNGVGVTQPFGRDSGFLLENLRLAGVRPEQIDALVITHAHIDHCWGIIGGDGKPNFPNAQIYMSKSDFDFWTDEAKQTTAGFIGQFVIGARRNLLPVRDRIKFVEDGKEVVPGVIAVATPGHTVGHHAYVIQSGTSAIMNIGDVAHHQILLLRRPQFEFAFDTDPKQSAQSRLRILRQLSNEKMPLVAYHFPFPGVGWVAAEGEGFGYYAAPFGTNL